MTADEEKDGGRHGGEGAAVLRFPQSRVAGKNKTQPIKNLGLSPLAKQLGANGTAPYGHWCSRCKGIWFGRAGEVECPVCANRQG